MKQLCTLQAAGKVFSALGLDVVDLHRAKRLDPRNLQALGIAGGQPWKVKTALQLGCLHRVQEADFIGEDPPVAGRLDAKCPAAVAVRAGILLKSDSGVDAEAQQQALHPPDEPLRNHVDFRERGCLPGRDETLCLENAPQVRRHHGKRRGIEAFRHDHVHSARHQAPALHEVAQSFAIESGPAAVELRVLGRDRPLMAVNVGEDSVER